MYLPLNSIIVLTPGVLFWYTLNFLNMNIIQQKFRTTLAHCTLLSTEDSVKNNLSYTPSDMRSLVKKGYPVAPQNLDENFFTDTDHRAVNDYSVDLWEKRGTSINDVWELQQDSKKKIRTAHFEGAFQPVGKED